MISEPTRVLGLGAGGHAKVVIEILRLCGGYDIIGLLDPREALWGTSVSGVEVLGDDRRLAEIYAGGVRWAFVGVGSVQRTDIRKRLYDQLRNTGFTLVRAVHPQAIVSAAAEIGAGPIIMAGAIVNPAARIGANVIINSGAIIEHDCLIEDHVHIATGARLSGGVTVQAGAHVGIGATIKQNVNIGRESVVGAGAVVIKDVPDGKTVVGVPAQVLGSDSDSRLLYER